LGEYRGLKGDGKKIAVLGCVAQQEGEDIFTRAPWVSLRLADSASYRKLPELLAQVEAGAQRVTGLDNDTGETFETEMTAATIPGRAYLNHHRRLRQVLRLLRGPVYPGTLSAAATCNRILQETKAAGRLGYSEVQFLGQNRQFLFRSFAAQNEIQRIADCCRASSGILRVRFTTSHPRDFTPTLWKPWTRVEPDCKPADARDANGWCASMASIMSA